MGVHRSHLSWEKVLVPSLGSAGRRGQSWVPLMVLHGMVCAGSKGIRETRRRMCPAPNLPMLPTNLGQDQFGAELEILHHTGGF